MTRSMRSLTSAALLAGVAALAATPPAHADTPGCTPKGASAIVPPGGNTFSADMRVYRFRHGPITACFSGQQRPAEELAGWRDRTTSKAGPGADTELIAGDGDCLAVLTVSDTSTGESAIDAFNPRLGTRWRLASGTSTFFDDSTGGGWRHDYATTPVFNPADCSATLTVKPANVQQTIPPGNVAIESIPGIRPRLAAAPVLTRTKQGRPSLTLRFTSKPRSATIVFGGKALVITNPAKTLTTAISAGSNAPVRIGRRYAVTVTACNEGCATATRRVALR